MYTRLKLRLLAVVLLAAMVTLGVVNMAQAQTANGPTSLSETYKSWTVHCVTPTAVKGQTAPARTCEMLQELRQKKSGQRLLAMALQPNKTGASLTFIAPFGLLLSEGVKVSVDGTPAAKGGFRTCLPQGCVSVINLANTALAKFAAGDKATVTMRGTKGREISLTLSLAGFTAAWNRLSGI